MKQLDYRQFQCPHPVVETRKEILANPGLTFQVLVADQVSCENIGRLATSLNYRLDQQPAEQGYLLTLTPAAGATTETAEPTPAPSAAGQAVVFISSDRMGDGDPELGKILLKNYLITLTELDQLPATILFVNSGVRLACQGSEVLEALNRLACSGVDIASCGLCLDFYQLKEKLAVGRITNMLEIAEAQLQTGRLVSL